MGTSTQYGLTYYEKIKSAIDFWLSLAPGVSFTIWLKILQPPYHNNNNKNKLYLHDHTSAYSIEKAISRNKITSQGNFVALVIIRHKHQSKLK